MSNEGRYERELVNALDAAGWGAMRCPSSGSGGDRDLPDILAGKGTSVHELGRLSNAYGIEHKAGQDTTLYVTGDEVEALGEFCAAFGAKPRLGARFKRNGYDRVHYLVPPENARITDGGNYGLPESSIEERADVVINATTGEIHRP